MRAPMLKGQNAMSQAPAGGEIAPTVENPGSPCASDSCTVARLHGCGRTREVDGHILIDAGPHPQCPTNQAGSKIIGGLHPRPGEFRVSSHFQRWIDYGLLGFVAFDPIQTLIPRNVQDRIRLLECHSGTMP